MSFRRNTTKQEKKSVKSDIQTLRSGLRKRGAAEFFFNQLRSEYSVLWLCKHMLNGRSVFIISKESLNNLHNRTCPCIYASMCGFLIGGEIWQVRSLPRPLRLLSYWGRWYDLLSPDKGQNATVPPLQVTQRNKKGQFNTIPCFFFRCLQQKKVNKPMNTLLHCLKWDVNQMILFWTKARRGNELPYKRRQKRELLVLLDPRELTNSRLWTFATIEWRFFISLSFLSLLFFFRLVTILYYLNDVDEGGQTAFVIADNSTLNETVR